MCDMDACLLHLFLFLFPLQRNGKISETEKESRDNNILPFVFWEVAGSRAGPGSLLFPGSEGEEGLPESGSPGAMRGRGGLSM